jgi:hypothetical protein
MHENNRGVNAYRMGSCIDDGIRLAAAALFSSISILDLLFRASFQTYSASTAAVSRASTRRSKAVATA